MFQRETFTFFYIKYEFYIFTNIWWKISLLIIESNQKKEFEKDTWLNIEQLEEKYHVNKDQILEKYNEIKYSQQTLTEEISNALNKTK